MRRYLLLAGALILTQLCGQLNALHFDGVTRTGMTFSGQVNHVQDGFIEVAGVNRGHPRQMGIPVSQVQSLRLADDSIHPDLLAKLEPVLQLLPLFDSRTQGIFVTQLESLAEEEQWARLYQWTGYLQQIPANATRAAHIAILKAWALMEMGLRQRAGDLLISLESSLDPLEASGLYCWLRARIAIEENLPEEARYWASLPMLKIPAYEGNLSKHLETIRNNLSNPKSS